jgi:hypothetical protein
MKRFKNKKDELAHIMIGAIVSGMNQELFDYQIEEFKTEYGEDLVFDVKKQYDGLINRLIEK